MYNLFIYWILFLPFIIWAGHYEGPKVFYFFLGVIFLLVFWIVRVLKYKKDIIFSQADYFFLIWLGILFISSIFGIHPVESIVGGSYRLQGVIFFLGLWLVGKTVGILTTTNKNFLIKGLGISIICESLIVVIQFIFGRLYFGKALGSLGEANAVAGFLAIGSYFVYQSFPKLVLIFPGLSILLELSRSGILAFLPNVIVGSRNQLKKLPKPIMFSILAISVLVILFISYAKKVSLFENRFLFWQMAVVSVSQRPVLGFGAESGEVVYNQAFKNYGMPLNNLVVDRAHNLILDVAMWSGIVGLIVFSLWLYRIFKDSKDIEKKSAIFAFLIYSFVQPLSIVHWILLIIIVNI